MFEILTLNKIAKCGLDIFDKNRFTVSDDVKDPDGIILRSFNMHEMEISSSLKAVARAGAGTNNIPIDKCTEKGIVVFNTPGANANAVKEMVISALLLSSRKITAGIEWAKTLSGSDVAKQVEKGKSAFAGPELEGKKLGVIGLGAIGVMVANVAYHLGMDVVGYDPYISVDAAWGLSRHVKKAVNINEIYEDCDYISLHVPLNDETKNMINKEAFASMKKGMRLLNLSRGELVDNKALKDSIEDGIIECYVTDFPNEEVLNMEGTICIPHLGASTPESEDNCARMAASQLKDFLLEGNIINSVNFPDCVLPKEKGTLRMTITHKNVPNCLNNFSTILSKENVNISHMLNKSKKGLAYTIIDIEGNVGEETIETIKTLDSVLSIRVIG